MQTKQTTSEEPPKPIPPPPSDIAQQMAARCWCDPATESRVMDPVLAMAFAERIDMMMGSMMTAWSIIANSSRWGSTRTRGWRSAAIRWRDEEFHELLGGREHALLAKHRARELEEAIR